MLKLAKIQFDKSLEKKVKKLPVQESTEITFSQSTEGSQTSQDEYDHLTFGNSLLRDIALQQRVNINEA